MDDVVGFAVGEKSLAGDQGVERALADGRGRGGMALVDVVQVGLHVAHPGVLGLLLREQRAHL